MRIGSEVFSAIGEKFFRFGTFHHTPDNGNSSTTNLLDSRSGHFVPHDVVELNDRNDLRVTSV